MIFRIAIFSSVSASQLSAGLHAKEWCDYCISVAGSGKGGGRPDQANATVPGGRETFDKLINAAQEFSLSKI